MPKSKNEKSTKMYEDREKDEIKMQNMRKVI